MVNASDDPIANYLNTDGSVNYGALGLDPSGAQHLGELIGIIEGASYPALVGFTDGDDVRVLNFDRMSWFGDYEFFQDGDGVARYGDLTFDTGGGGDTLVFYSRGNTAIIEAVCAVTGNGEDMVVIDVHGEADLLINGLDISTGAKNEQILIDDTDGSSEGWARLLQRRCAVRRPAG